VKSVWAQSGGYLAGLKQGGVGSLSSFADSGRSAVTPVAPKPVASESVPLISGAKAAAAAGSASLPLSSRTSVIKPGSSYAPTKPSMKSVSAQSGGYLAGLKQGGVVGLSSFADSGRSAVTPVAPKPVASESVPLIFGAQAAATAAKCPPTVPLAPHRTQRMLLLLVVMGVVVESLFIVPNDSVADLCV
jgi:hypothetical protein